MIKIISNISKRNLVAKICAKETICLITDGTYNFGYEMSCSFNQDSVLCEISADNIKSPESIGSEIVSIKRSRDFDYFVLYFNVPEADIIEFAKDFETRHSIPEGQLILACRQSKLQF